MKQTFVVAITGASGAVYAVRLLEVLLAAGSDVYLTVSAAAGDVLRHELNVAVDLDSFAPSALLPLRTTADPKLAAVRELAGATAAGNVCYCHYGDLLAPIASGSFLTHGMVVCPCSGGTLSAIVHGASTNLIHRAAEVHLKERRKLILVPRETPLSLLQLENLRRAAEAGAVVLPAMPGFYQRPTTLAELVDFVVGRICDQLGVGHALVPRWGS